MAIRAPDGANNGAKSIKLRRISYISEQSASARKTREGRSSKCLGLEGGSSTKFCIQQLPWRPLSYFGLYCFVSASIFGDNFTIDDLTSDYYSFWNCPGGLSYDCFAPLQHNLKEYHKYFHQTHFCVIPISINQSSLLDQYHIVNA